MFSLILCLLLICQVDSQKQPCTCKKADHLFDGAGKRCDDCKFKNSKVDSHGRFTKFNFSNEIQILTAMKNLGNVIVVSPSTSLMLMAKNVTILPVRQDRSLLLGGREEFDRQLNRLPLIIRTDRPNSILLLISYWWILNKVLGFYL